MRERQRKEEEATDTGFVDEDGSTWELDPSHPDHDLSEAAGYGQWEPAKEGPLPRWVIVAVSLVAIIALLAVPLYRLLFG